MNDDLKKPKSLTSERAFGVLPQLEMNEEWVRKKEAGELPEGIASMFGCMKTVWSEEKLTKEEAEYVLWLEKQMSWRGLAYEVFGDSNQIFGMHLVEAAKKVIETNGWPDEELLRARRMFS